MFRRYAIYVTPDGPLGTAGAAWLGWDIATGQTVPHPNIDGLDLAAITRRPRRYGLHATVKPPMTLATGCSSEQLKRAAGALARSAAPVTIAALAVTRLGRFLALIPLGDTGALDALAAQVVETLDPFRAAPGADELARRKQTGLSASQLRNLARWGYPHVMEDYRFHVTLTGPLADSDRVIPKAAAHFAPVLPTPFVIDHLTLAGEDAQGMFHSIARLPLRG